MAPNFLTRADFNINGHNLTILYDSAKYHPDEIGMAVRTGEYTALSDISIMPTSHADFLTDEGNRPNIITLPIQYLD